MLANALLWLKSMEGSIPRIVCLATLKVFLLGKEALVTQYARRPAMPVGEAEQADDHFGSSLLAIRRTNGADMLLFLVFLKRYADDVGKEESLGSSL